MSILKDIGNAIMRAGEVVVSKTEKYSKIAKISLDIKLIEGQIEKVQTEIGKFVVEKINAGEQSIGISDAFIAEKTSKIKDGQASIESKKKELEELKASD